ncbi:unnamed protein product [Psylliodes chrysocephalus]|uniref:Uncharacterized protein n=1 Tax=Psylliodes chrysocephalus TaxID=3402493 RepID=A0A9P0DAN5_9CUCU|nr:unnamed protein product [Psylliodes chrysocephala]
MSTNKTGESKIMFAYFDEIDEIFKKDHNIEPVAIASSSNNNFPSETTTHDSNNENVDDPRSKKKKNKTGGKNTKRRQRKFRKKNEVLNLCRQLISLAKDLVPKNQ